MTVAYWNVYSTGALTDRALFDSLELMAEGELRLAASREDAEVVGQPTRVEIPLYYVEQDTEDGVVRRLEPATWLGVAGIPIPDEPAAVVVRWEQPTRRRPWQQPARRWARLRR